MQANGFHVSNQNDRSFWKARSQNYQQLEWTQQPSYLNAFLRAGDFDLSDEVLDVGTGTGIIAHAVAPIVKRVVGVDYSDDMLQQACINKAENEEFRVGDLREQMFPAASFDKITARMVFHHILTNIDTAMANCYEYLREDGRLILSEGVPPHADLKDWYTQMFTLKEERRTFMEEDLLNLVRGAGFRSVDMEIYTAPQMSIRNWLEKSGLPQETQDQIYGMHLDLNGLGTKHYRMRVTEDDIFCDWKFVILKASK
jgi:ubiquinone/menaquinone biosynthesis C-methylase UbiE